MPKNAPLDDSVTNSIANIQQLDGQLNLFVQNLGTYSEAALKASQMIKGNNANTGNAVSASGTININGISESRNQISKLKKDFKNLKLNEIINSSFDKIESSKLMRGIAASAKYAYNVMGKSSKKVNQIIGSAGAIAWAQAQETAMKSANAMTGGMLDLQKNVMDLEKTALQMGVGFGQSFDQAQDGTGQFLNQFATMRGQLNASKEDLSSIGKAFKDNLSATHQIQAFGDLSKVNEKLGHGMNMTSAAFLVAKATGMETGTVAEWMGEMYTELGEDIDGAATSLGAIANVAEGSDLSFNKVGASIMKSASQLKMWGGTVKGVAPMFKAFSESLIQGQKGLAPELLEKYASALESMDFSKRALMGLQMPSMQGKGAIGAGLEMEAAMEGGPEGMKKVSDGLLKTLKQFGGGQIVTRKQAIDNPALERSFMVQRGILKQMLGTNDAQGTKMLNAMQKMDKGNIEGAKDAEESLADLMKAGKDTQKSTTDAVTAAGNLTAEASLKAADNILIGLVGMLSELGGKKAVVSYNKMMKNVFGKGRIKMGDITKGVIDISSGRRPPKAKSQPDIVETKKYKMDTVRGLKDFRKRGEGSVGILQIAKDSGATKKQRRQLSQKMEETFIDNRKRGKSIEKSSNAAKRTGLEFITAMNKATIATKKYGDSVKPIALAKNINEVKTNKVKEKIDKPNNRLIEKPILKKSLAGSTMDIVKKHTDVVKNITNPIQEKTDTNMPIISKPNITDNFDYIKGNKKRQNTLMEKIAKTNNIPIESTHEAYTKINESRTNEELENKTFDIAKKTSNLANKNTSISKEIKDSNKLLNIDIKLNVETEVSNDGIIKIKPVATILNSEEFKKKVRDALVK